MTNTPTPEGATCAITVIPDRWVVRDRSGAYFTHVDHDTGEAQGGPLAEAAVFPTRQLAEDTASRLRLWHSVGVKVVRWPEHKVAEITPEGRQIVAARRAARKAERGW